MPNEPPKVYIDSCAYISCIQEDVGRHETVSAVVEQAKSGEIVIVASTLIIAEVVKLDHLSEQGVDIAEQAERIRLFFENDYIKFRAVDRRIAEEAAAISRQHRIKPPDAIHLATALQCGCTSFQTYDGEDGGNRRLLGFDGVIGSPPLKIEVPRVMGDDQPGLF